MKETGNPDIGLYMQREQNIVHAPYEKELRFYEQVKQGEVEEIDVWMREHPIGSGEGFGTLSDNPVNNLRYHIIVSIAMITRFCIEGGMDIETAYGLSDMYIRKADVIKEKEELVRMHRRMCVDFTQRMRRLKKETIYSKHIVLCVDYIHAHIHERITTGQLAQHCGLHVSYLSRLFKKETGVGIGDYIRNRKIEGAQNMLKYSEYSFSEIATFFAFSSQSHFVKVFRECVGVTPKEYRNQYYRMNWGEKKNV
ncbi:MAG: AraC family transcriptional regulator [Lachnospiraceae bacterium]|nr:AraC family transcriptional regulator [Lachnospiraceae bacterium]